MHVCDELDPVLNLPACWNHLTEQSDSWKEQLSELYLGMSEERGLQINARQTFQIFTGDLCAFHNARLSSTWGCSTAAFRI